MAMNERVATSEDTLAMLRDRAKEQDAFSVKVFRRKHMSIPPELVSTLSGALLSHFVNPELWVPQLCGGGKFHLQAFHASDMNKPVGGVIMIEIANLDSKEVDIVAPTRSGWQGPAEITFPLKDARPAQQDMGYGTSISPPGPGSTDSASRTTHGWPRPPGGGVSREQYGDGPGWETTRAGLATIEAERRRFEEEKLAAEREKHKNEIAALQKSHEADNRALKAELMGEIRAAKPTGPDPMTTLLTTMMAQQSEDRRASELRQAEDRRAAAVAQERSDARFSLLIEKMNDKPKENPLDMIAKVIEITGGGKKGNDGVIEAQTKMMHSMSEMMGQQVSVAMDFVSAAADLQLGQQGGNEPGWVKGIESVVKTVGAMAKGVQVKRPAPAGQQPLPPQAQAHPDQQYVQPAPGSQAVPVQQFAKPPAKPKAPVEMPPAIDQFINAIKNYGLPPAQIAKALVTNISDPSLIEAFAAAGGDFEALIQQRLGAWANEKPENAQYLIALIAEVKRQFVEAGIIEADAPVGQQTEEEGAGEEEEEGQIEEGDGDDGEDE